MYRYVFKRVLDFSIALIALLVLSPVFLLLTLIGAIAMKGNPFFSQVRPGKEEKLFRLLKFRTMTDKKDEDGNLLSDDERITGYGRFLRSTSLDELPQLLNILVGQMAFIGPRPQLVRDMVFMSEEDRKRHSVRPGLTGLAQVHGRNTVGWDKKFEYDRAYIAKITFFGDVAILFKTVASVFKREGIHEEGRETGADYGDYLLSEGRVDRATYDAKQTEAKILLDGLPVAPVGVS